MSLLNDAATDERVFSGVPINEVLQSQFQRYNRQHQKAPSPLSAEVKECRINQEPVQSAGKSSVPHQIWHEP